MSITSAIIGIPIASYIGWLLIPGIIIVAFYLYATRTHDFFKKRQIPYLKPLPLIGTSKAAVFRTLSQSEMVQSLYMQMTDQRVIGIFDLQQPVFMVRDPEIIKQVCVKEFDHFMNHRVLIVEKTDVLFSKSLFGLSDKRWKDMRATLSPAFTSSKMKAMLLLISECGKQAKEYLLQSCNEQPGGPDAVLEIEMKDFFTRIANDVIATSAFGVECNSLKQPKNEFYVMGKDITNFSGLRSLLLFIYALSPKIAELSGISFFSKKATDFFTSMVRETIGTREREGIVRPDMIHLMKEASKAGELDSTKIKLNEDDIAAQAILFFFAGYETVALLLCFSTYVLALNPDIQERLQQEIDSALEEHNGELSYETLQHMKYLDMVISETLRKYPPVPTIDRLCSKPLIVPATDMYPAVSFEKGDNLWVPIYALHHDPKYYPEPDKFDPERFSDERKDSIVPFTYLPFGLGPRMCIAQRFALMEVKAVLTYLLSNFTIHAVDKTPIPMKFSKMSFNATSATGFWCGIKLRNKQ